MAQAILLVYRRIVWWDALNVGIRTYAICLANGLKNIWLPFGNGADYFHCFILYGGWIFSCSARYVE